MVKEYNGVSYILAIASYNGGLNNIKKWLNIYGDPRTFTNHREVFDWLKHIPFYDTRNYVQRVLENLQIYRRIIQKYDRLTLIDNLLVRKNSKNNERTKYWK